MATTYPTESPRLRWPLVLLLAVTVLAAVLMAILIAQQGPGHSTSRGTTTKTGLWRSVPLEPVASSRPGSRVLHAA